MAGLHRTTGKVLSGIDHLRQSIVDILTTPIGSRVMRRDYGSRLYQLVDAPMNRQTLVEIYAATAEALLKWEPRLHVTRIVVDSIENATITISIEGEYRPTVSPIVIDDIVV